MSYQYKLNYKKGTTNTAANALSWAPHPDATLNAITVAQPLWLQNLQSSYDSNAVAQKMLSLLTLQNPFGHFSLHQGIIKYKGVIWLGHSPELQTKSTDQLHSSPIGGHSGFLVTYGRVCKLFY
jgi:hypothetical protein